MKLPSIYVLRSGEKKNATSKNGKATTRFELIAAHPYTLYIIPIYKRTLRKKKKILKSRTSSI